MEIGHGDSKTNDDLSILTEDADVVSFIKKNERMGHVIHRDDQRTPKDVEEDW